MTEEDLLPLLNGDVRKEEWEVGGGSKLGRKVWAESKTLWVIVGPAIFGRIATYSMNVITQAFAGHLGDLELASVSFANTVVVGFNYGLMVRPLSTLKALALPLVIQFPGLLSCLTAVGLGLGHFIDDIVFTNDLIDEIASSFVAFVCCQPGALLASS
ncbi:hypothetical protein PR202_gb18831 [Eleusine coracana subsp. coracana]|uniref:Protein DETOXIFICATION n=1 Tax=Eleusine coracana subsp. coracana TaxID=191504 RepID=A0AAV5F777_ELECO|nr:hypothetical protein PR202_gb18831 [Eleusine coracana subsp. coracana]